VWLRWLNLPAGRQGAANPEIFWKSGEGRELRDEMIKHAV